MTDIVKDISTLTTIPEKTLNKFFRKMTYCICESVQEDMLQENENQIVELDIGIGILYIKYTDGENLKYHFEPNELLSKSLKQTVINKQNLLEDLLNDSLAKKFMEVYKDLC